MDFGFIGQIILASVIGAALVGAILYRAPIADAPWGLDGAPFPVWIVDAKGDVVVRNAACSRLGHVTLPKEAGRVQLGGIWVEVTVQPDRHGHVLCAIPVEGVVRAEAALRDFRTTMSDTFAQLDTGLGLFDAAGRMQMFNPAMADLTGLPVDFLLRQPSFGAVLDALRDQGMLPEPKDWLAWRRMMLEFPLMHGAATHEETWALPGGVTWRAMLRPQAKGSFALLIEDISPEMIRSRRYRADMELAQSVIDTMEEGIAVFAATGELVLSNAAYTELWGHDPGTSLDDGCIGIIASYWRDVSAPDPLWSRIEAFIGMTGDREMWHAKVRLLDGRLIACRIAPIWDGATMAAFRPVATDDAIPDGMASVVRHRAMLAG